MAQLGGEVPDLVLQVRSSVLRLLAEHSYSAIDADSLTTGKDFLLKIWQIDGTREHDRERVLESAG
jgi:hypothetical protein